MAACGSMLCHHMVLADSPAPTPAPTPAPPQNAPQGPPKLMVTVGKSLIIDSPLNIMRVVVANGDLAEAVAVNPKEVLINGKAAGETSLIVWQQGGSRLVYDLNVRMNQARLDAARQQIAREFPNDNISLTFDNDTPFVRGTVPDVSTADRVLAIAATLATSDKKPVNLLHVAISPVEPQVLLQVRFATVDRQASLDLGLHLFSTAFNQQTSTGTGYALFPDPTGLIPVKQTTNILLSRPDINLLAELQALETKSYLQILAEPNLLAISGEKASMLAGGEFPFPIVQPSLQGALITIMWREYGVRLNFTPTVTPRGTIRLRLEPEVSSLDYTNAVSIQGFTIPALATRRVNTEIELDSGQSFAIAGLLDNQTRDSLQKVPGIGNIPLIGKLFQQKDVLRQNTELLVLVTPEVVRPIPPGQKTPDIQLPGKFLKDVPTKAPRTPGMDQTGPVPVKPPTESLPYDRVATPKQGPQVNPNPANTPVLLVPVPVGTPPGAGGSSSSSSGTSKQ
jgi:pilus assembly protein CpaC